MTRTRRLIFGMLAAAWVLLPVAAVAAARAVSTLQPSTIAMGESAQLDVQIVGSDGAAEPPAVRVEGVEVGPVHSGLKQSVEIVNGRFTQSTIAVYSYELTPRRAGAFTIPALVFRVGGEEVRTQPVALRVEKAGAQPDAMDTQGHGEIFVPKKTAWVGEQLPVQFRLLVDSRIDWNFSALPGYEAEGFQHSKTSQPRREVIERDGRTWDLGSFQAWLTPTRAGKLQIGPAEMAWRAQVPRAQRARPSSPFADIFPEDLFRDLRNGFGVVQQMRTKTEPFELTVKPLPAQGQPAGFSGAVGKFQLTAEGSPARVKIGDPVTVKLTVTGQGNFDRVTAPGLAETKGWRAYPATETTPPHDEEAGPAGKKTFEVAVIPEAKQTQMPVFEFAFFEPEAAKYVTLRTAAAPLVVEGEPPLTLPTPAAAAPAAGLKPASSQPTDILGLRYDAGPRVFTRPLYRERGFLLAQLLPLAVLAGWMATRLRRTTNEAARQTARWRRERAALAAQLRRERDRQAFFATAAQLLQHDAALRTGQAPETVEAGEARRAARDDVPVEEIFEERSAALFAGGGAGAGELAEPERQRLLHLLLPLALAGFFLVPASLRASAFDEGNALYDQQKFADAKSRFEAAVNQEGPNANLLYNLGNTEYRLAQPGRAVLQYERALALEPTHPEAQANLALVRRETGGGSLAGHLSDVLIPPWPPAAFSISLAAGGWLAIFAVAALALRNRWDSLSGWLALFLGAGIFAWSGFALWHEAAQATVAVTLPAQTDSRTEPADRSTLVAPLTAGSEVRVLSERGAWTYCELPGARRGWLPSSSIELLHPSSGS